MVQSDYSPHARHFPGIGLGTSRYAAGIYAHTIVCFDRATGCRYYRVGEGLAGLHLVGGHGGLDDSGGKTIEGPMQTRSKSARVIVRGAEGARMRR